MTVGTELAPGPNAVDITPTKDAGIMKEIKVIKDFILLTCVVISSLCLGRFLGKFYLHGFMNTEETDYFSTTDLCRWRARVKASHGQGTRCTSTTPAPSPTGRPMNLIELPSWPRTLVQFSGQNLTRLETGASSFHSTSARNGPCSARRPLACLTT